MTTLTRQTGEEIFLGPKISFASARQPGKQDEDNRPTANGEDPKGRTSARERGGTKDRDGREKSRFEKHVGNPEDIRGFGGQKKGYEKRAEDSEDFTAEEAEARRRAKLDQPWFRGERRIQDGADESLEPSGDRGWRGRDRRDEKEWSRGGRVEEEPAWMKEEPVEADLTLHTQEDFEKWKESMKGGSSQQQPEPAASGRAMQETFDATPAANPAARTTTIAPVDNDSVFNLWSEPKREEHDGQMSTPKTTTKAKSSRFQQFFGPTAQEQVPQQQQQEVYNEPLEQQTARSRPTKQASPPIQNKPAPKTTSRPGQPQDQEALAFQNVLQMLRVGNDSAQNPSTPLFSPPSAAPEPAQRTRGSSANNQQLPQPASRQPVTARPQQSVPQPPSQPQQPQPAQPAQRPPPVSRDSEFLLKLMQQPMQQNRVPFTEGQIYGQSYTNRASPGEITTLLNNLNVSHGLPITPSGPPPPGMYSNERAFAAHQHVPQPPRQPQHGLDDRMASAQGPHMRQQPQDDLRFQQAPPPGFDSNMHYGPGRQGPGPEQMVAPPGLQQQGRGPPVPPTFYGQQIMRGPAPPQASAYYGQGMPPPNIGMSPAYPPGFNGPPLPNLPGQGRRPPSLQMQQGFDVYGPGGGMDPARRGQPMQQAGQYQQYMK